MIRAILLAAAMGAAGSVDAAPGSPILENLAQTKTIRLGFRDSSIPFSYIGSQGEPLGFSVDLCKRIVDSMAQDLKLKQIAIDWVPITSSTRISAIKTGKIDMECGSTTNTADRRKDVAFTVPHYIAGVRILSRANAALSTPMALEGKTVSTNQGSTAADMLVAFNGQLRRPIKLLLFATSAESFGAVRDGKADAWLHDDIQLIGQRALASNPADYVVSSAHLSVEPLAVMLPRDDAELKAAVDRHVRSLMRSGEIHKLYAKWFELPIAPNGVNLRLPMNSLTRDIYRNPSDYVPDLRVLRLQ